MHWETVAKGKDQGGDSCWDSLSLARIGVPERMVRQPKGADD